MKTLTSCSSTAVTLSFLVPYLPARMFFRLEGKSFALTSIARMATCSWIRSSTLSFYASIPFTALSTFLKTVYMICL